MYQDDENQDSAHYTTDDVVRLYEELQDMKERYAAQEAAAAQAPGTDLRQIVQSMQGSFELLNEDKLDSKKNELTKAVRASCIDYDGKPQRENVKEIKAQGVPISAKGLTVTIKLDPDLGDIHANE